MSKRIEDIFEDIDILRELGISVEDENNLKHVNEILVFIGTTIFIITIGGSLILNRNEIKSKIQEFLNSFK